MLSKDQTTNLASNLVVPAPHRSQNHRSSPSTRQVEGKGLTWDEICNFMVTKLSQYVVENFGCVQGVRPIKKHCSKYFREAVNDQAEHGSKTRKID